MMLTLHLINEDHHMVSNQHQVNLKSHDSYSKSMCSMRSFAARYEEDIHSYRRVKRRVGYFEDLIAAV